MKKYQIELDIPERHMHSVDVGMGVPLLAVAATRGKGGYRSVNQIYNGNMKFINGFENGCLRFIHIIMSNSITRSKSRSKSFTLGSIDISQRLYFFIQ